MECTCISYRHLPKASRLFLDYLYDYERVAPFYTHFPFDLRSYQQAAQSFQLDARSRRRLAEILHRQNAQFGCAEPTRAHIDLLAGEGTFAVVTGQQVGLFSGPAFTLYKALTAIRLAQWLTEQGLRSVPVFWLATEDHDLAEVAQTAIFDEDYQLVPLADAGVRPAPRSSVGYVRLSETIPSTLERLASLLPAGERRDRLVADLQASYPAGARWGEAFGRFMTRLFGRWGVVLLDALDPELHELASGVYQTALARAPELRGRLLERSRALVAAGYHAQVHVGRDSTLLFATADGNRVALHQAGTGVGAGFSLDGAAQASLAELQSRIRSHPGEFSANALLRPVVQDTVLPTVACVAGPSELAYHAQTQVLYPAFGRPQPVLFPRAGFTLLDQRTRRLMEKYRLRLEDAWQGEDHLNRKIAAVGFAEGWSDRLDQSEQDLTRLLERLRGDIERLDPTLVDALRHAEEKMRYHLERLRGRITRAAFERSEILRRHAQALERFLLPRQELQEREVSGVYFLAHAGYELLDRLLVQIPTHSAHHQTLVY